MHEQLKLTRQGLVTFRPLSINHYPNATSWTKHSSVSLHMLTGWWTADGWCKISLNPELQLQGFIPPFHHSTVPPFHHSTIPLFHYSTIPIPDTQCQWPHWK
jgi:hypothetical protein